MGKYGIWLCELYKYIDKEEFLIFTILGHTLPLIICSLAVVDSQCYVAVYALLYVKSVSCGKETFQGRYSKSYNVI